MSKHFINFLSCATCHGFGTETLFENIIQQNQQQKDHLDNGSPFFQIPTSATSSYKDKAEEIINELLEKIPFHPQEKSMRWGFILSSTKALSEDFVWTANNQDYDAFTPVTKFIQQKYPIEFHRAATVSNACTSSHGAIELAQKWLSRNWVDQVLVLGFDLVGPFTLKGFQSLRALSEGKKIKAFDKNRDGLLLGDGAAICILSNDSWGEKLEINPVHTLCEGVSATRPNVDGDNLVTCYQQSSQGESPDLVIAHGTGTYYNDLTESNAITKYLGSKTAKVFASKWSIGHSLGASGLIDLCIAKESIQRNLIPTLPPTIDSDLAIKDYLALNFEETHQVKKVLISSLGFGGMCSGLFVKKQETL